MRITTIIENHPNPNRQDLQAEHGLSFYIETQGHVYLSDVGQSGKFADNADRLGLDLAKVEALAISHHHYDHGGGLRRFLSENDCAKVYLRQTPTEDFVADSPPDPLRYIGLNKRLLREHHARIETIEENQEVTPGLHLLTDIPDQFPKSNGDLQLQIFREDGGLRPDKFSHEMLTVVEEDTRLVLLTGCAHTGVLNMLAAVHQAFPDRSIQAVIGGFHLHHEDFKAVVDIAQNLCGEDIPTIVSGHCTGKKAIKLLEDRLGNRFKRLYSGMVMDF